MFTKKRLSPGSMWLLAAATVLLFSGIVNVLSKPMLNSGDDFFLLYIMGGGYEMQPSNLLHYDYGWHPLLSSAVSKLFTAYPHFNWYTLLLLLFHMGGCSAILYVLLTKFSWGTSFLLFGIFFLFIETRFQLSLNFTHSSIVAAAGGLMLLLYNCQRENPRRADTIFAILLLLMAGLLRLHVVWMSGFIFIASSIVLLSRKQFVKYMLFFATAVILLIGFNFIQKIYYRNQIPAWDEHEKSRQALFAIFNKPSAKIPWQEVFTDSTEREMFSHGLFYDTNFFSTSRLRDIGNRITRKRTLNRKEDRAILYWNFMESRIYLLLLFLLVFLLWVQHAKKKIERIILLMLPAACIYGYLFIFFKTNFSLFYGLWLLAILPIYLLLEQNDFRRSNKKFLPIVAIVSILSVSCWMITKLVKQNALNSKKHERFVCAINELNRHPDMLFLSTDDDFPLDYFYIWDTPKGNLVRNFVYKVWWQIDAYPEIYHKYGITDLREEIGNNPSILMLGNNKRAIEMYFNKVSVSDSLPQFRCFSAFRIKKIK